MAPSKRNYSQRRALDIQSLNQCAFPGCTNTLVEPGSAKAGPAVTAHICHIHAISPRWARWKEGLTKEELSSIDNLILLCRHHHAVVDLQPEIYTPEVLRQWKSKHEADVSRRSGGLAIISELVSQRTVERLDRLRKSRFLPSFDQIAFSLKFAKSLVDGELSVGAAGKRSRALAWCARVLSHTEQSAKAGEYLGVAKDTWDCPEVTIAQAFVSSHEGDKGHGLGMLNRLDSPMARSAALVLVRLQDGPRKAIDWLNNSGITVRDLDAEGKLCLLFNQLGLGEWLAAQNSLEAVTDADLESAPVLHAAMARTLLAEAVPEEFRSIVLDQLPFPAAHGSWLASSAHAMDARRRAQEHFFKAAEVAEDLDCRDEATTEEEYALWLELMNPDTKSKGQERLETKLGNLESPSALRFVRLGVEFGLRIDHDAIDGEIRRQVALNGTVTLEVAYARFALALAQPTSIEAANYLERHSRHILEHIDAKSVLSTQIELLCQAGLVDRAKEILGDLLSREDLSEVQKRALRVRISEAKGIDTSDEYVRQFRKTNALRDLVTLIGHLELEGDTDGLCEYGRTLFQRAASLSNAECFASALFNSQKVSQLAEFLESIEDTYVDQSGKLGLLDCWVLYYRGEVLKARSRLNELDPDWETPAYRELCLRLTIALGDWTSLTSIVEMDWAERSERSAQDLIRAAQLAVHLGLPNAKQLLFAAAEKGDEEPEVLATAYSLAAMISLEGEREVSKWIERAASISGEEGPVKRMPLEGLLAQKSAWDRKESEVGQLVKRGEIPLFLAGQSMNRSLIDLVLFPALRNTQERDPRRRQLVRAYSGSRGEVPKDLGKSAAFDVSALLTLGYLEMLQEAFDAFEEVYVPHSTLEWLFEEKQKAVFHQPSLIREATEVIQMVGSGTLEKVGGGLLVDGDLSDQIGQELALLIAEAEQHGSMDGPQGIVVHPGPVHRVGSLMAEEVDLTAHASVLVSCGSLVDRPRGQITAQARRKAKAYLQTQERPWPNEPAITHEAVLYMGSLAVGYLQHAGMLRELARAGFRIVVSPQVISDAEHLVAFGEVSQVVVEVIERIRYAVGSGIEGGTIKVGRSPSCVEGESWAERGNHHPTECLFLLAGQCDAIITDDRFLNRREKVTSDVGSTATYTTLDLMQALDRENVGTEAWERKTILRRAGYLHIPVGEEELQHHLQNSAVRDGRVTETAELRAIRENILCVRMRDGLQIPSEAQWLVDFFRTSAQVLENLWMSEVEVSETRVRSDWIVDHLDIRGWSECFGEEVVRDLLVKGQGTYLLPVLSAPRHSTPEIRKEYWKWAEERILAPMKQQNPQLFSWMIERQREVIAEVAAKDPYEEGGWDG